MSEAVKSKQKENAESKKPGGDGKAKVDGAEDEFNKEVDHFLV